MKIYLDTSTYNRPFDDQRQPKVFLETQAVKLLVIQTALVQSPQERCCKGSTETNMQFRCSTAYPNLANG